MDAIRTLAAAYPEWTWAEEGSVIKGVRGDRSLEAVQHGAAWRIEACDSIVKACGIHEDLIVSVQRAIYNAWHNK